MNPSTLSFGVLPRPQHPLLRRSAALEAMIHMAAEWVVGDWSHLRVVRRGFAPDQPAADHLHVAVDLQGSWHGLLAVSAQPRLGAMLAVATTGDPDAGDFAHEALVEFSQLLQEHLLEQGARASFPPSARRVLAQELPAGPPAAALRLVLNGYPLEIRFWRS